jgi:benzoyl-CoA reductase/2-hydroxyglutaryl-CoA dehydratase subunit BcrC/BadD/HgdB
MATHSKTHNAVMRKRRLTRRRREAELKQARLAAANPSPASGADATPRASS